MMVEVTFTESDGITSTMVDETRWHDTVEENRPYLASGTVITVKNEYDGIVYGETITEG